MNEKLKKLLNRFSGATRFQWGKGLRFLRWLLLAFFGTLGTLILASVIWFKFFPISKSIADIKLLIQDITHAEDLSIGKVQWEFSPKVMGIGVVVDDVFLERCDFARRFTAPKVKVLFEPLKIFLGKLPVRIQADHGEWVLPKYEARLEKDSGDETKSGGNHALLSAISIARKLRLKLKLEKFTVVGDPGRLGYSVEDSLIKATDVDLDTTLVGLPGSFSSDFKADVEVILGGKSFRAKGPMRVEAEGYSQFFNERPVGLLFTKLSTDMSELYVSAGKGVFEKPPGMAMDLESSAQAVLTDDYRLQSFDIKSGSFHLDEIALNIAVNYAVDQKTFSLKWLNNPQTVHALKFPIHGFTHVPVKGMVQLQGNIKTNAEFGFEGGWKLSFNNLRVSPLSFSKIFSPTSKGDIVFSLVSEGAYTKGIISTPRTEMQINATPAHFEIGNGDIVKPTGDPLNILLKAAVKDDELSVSRIEVSLNNLELKGNFGLTNFTQYLKGKKAGFLGVNLESNPVDLARWSSYIPFFRKIPLEGIFQIAGTADGPLYPDESGLKDVSWRVDRANISKVRGSFDRDSFLHMGYKPEDLSVEGPFNLDFIFQGRGRGYVIERGTLIAQADFTKVFAAYGDWFRKPKGIPLQLDLSIEQTTNKFSFRRGLLKLHEMSLLFDGTILQGSKRNWVDLKLLKPVDLTEWRELFANMPVEFPLSGKIDMAARLGFEQAGVMEGNLDWRKLTFDGDMGFKNVALRLGKLKNPITKGNGRLVVNGSGLIVPGFKFEMAGSEINVSGTARAFAKISAAKAVKLSKTEGNLGWFFSREPWEVSSTVTMDEFRPEIFALLVPKKAINMTEEALTPSTTERVKKVLNNAQIAESRGKLVFQAGKSKAGKLQSQNISSIIKWEKGIARAEPFAVTALGGKIVGSLSFDANPYLLRKDPPTLTLAAKTQNFEADQVMEYFHPEALSTIKAADKKSLIGGKFDGQMNLVFQGFESSDFKKTAKGRVYGRLSNAQWAGLAPLRSALEEFMSQSVARDYLIKQSRISRCMEDRFGGTVDLQLNSGSMELQQSDLRFAGGSRLVMTGEMDDALKTRMSGDLYLGAACVFGEARSCLVDEQNQVDLSFSLAGSFASPELTSQLAERAEGLVQCMKQRIAMHANVQATDRQQRRTDAEKKKRLQSLIKEN